MESRYLGDEERLLDCLRGRCHHRACNYSSGQNHHHHHHHNGVGDISKIAQEKEGGFDDPKDKMEMHNSEPV